MSADESVGGVEESSSVENTDWPAIELGPETQAIIIQSIN